MHRGEDTLGGERDGRFQMIQQIPRLYSGLMQVMRFVLFATVLLFCREAAGQTTAQEALENQPAEEVFKNIQVLKGIRAADLQGAMSFIASSLNVDCDYCHRGEDFSKDVTKQKLRAREMIRMVRQINQEAFIGENRVNCFTCHQGRLRRERKVLKNLSAPYSQALRKCWTITCRLSEGRQRLMG